MAKAMVEVLVDDLDGSEASESVRIGWNGQWRELELSEKNLAGLSKAFDKFWDAGRPVRLARSPRRRGRSAATTTSAPVNGQRDPEAIRVWADAQGLAVASRGRIPADVEAQYLEAMNR